jgi:alanine dehydrogenase
LIFTEYVIVVVSNRVRKYNIYQPERLSGHVESADLRFFLLLLEVHSGNNGTGIPRRVVIFMIIGVPKEIKNNENRVALTPAGAAVLRMAGHQVIVEKDAGFGSGFEDEVYIQEGAEVVPSAAEVWAAADLILKVKEPLQEEFGYFREGQILFTYLHLAAAPELSKELIKKKVTGIAYETIQLPTGGLPLLTPMSEVAGRMSVQVGAQFLEAFYGGRGILLGGVPGVPPAEVIIIGGGIVGTNAARMALGMGASVVIIDKSADRLRYIDEVFHGQIRTLMSNPYNVMCA